MVKKPDLDDYANWKQRFRAAAFHHSQIASENPDQGILASSQSGTIQWYAWHVPSGELKQITDMPGGHSSHLLLSPDGKWVYSLLDHHGDEIGQFARMPVQGGGKEIVTQGIPPFSPFGCSLSRNGNRFAFIASYENSFELYCLDIKADGEIGDLRKIYSSSQLMIGAQLSHDGDLIFVQTAEKTGNPDYALMAFDASNGEKVAELWDGDSIALEIMLVSPLAGDSRVLATSTITGTERLILWSPLTGERADLNIDHISGSIRAYDWSSDGNLILFRTYNQAIQKLYLHHLSSGDTKALEVPEGICWNSSFISADSKEIFLHWENAHTPSSLLTVSSATGEVVDTLFSAERLPAGHRWESMIFPSSDGEIIQGWLIRPDGEGPFPTIIETHGGPTAVQSNCFHREAQAWANHGFAFLSINYRGSLTFGAEFEQKIWGNPGHWEVEDIVAARAWLIDQKIAKADAVLLTGWSYGGYLTLLALGKYPDLWAGGMAGIAIADWKVSYEDSAGALRGYQVALFGGTPDEKPEQYAISSPITYAENIKAPILIIQGKQDTRTPARAIIEYEKKLKSLDKVIDVQWFEIGHMGSFTSNDIAVNHQTLMLEFAYRTLGDSNESEMPK